MNHSQISPTGDSVTQDLDFFCRELDSVTNNLILCTQLASKSDVQSKFSEINIASLIRASHRLRDLSLVGSGYLLA